MNSSETILLRTASDWLKQENEILLVTVANTWGSSPRPVGSMMLIKQDGEFIGSVSGGCIEENLINKYLTGNLPDKNVFKLSYGIDQLDTQKYGLPCGGKLELFIEKLNSTESFKLASRALQANKPIVRRLNVKTGTVSYRDCDRNQQSHFDGTYLHKIFGPQWQLLLIGANELSKFVAEFALLLNYQIIICDPREHINTSWISEGMTFTTNMPDEAIAKLSPVEQSIVLALTHDPKMDDMALMQALTMELFYVGAIGSLKTQAARRNRLQQLNLSTIQISKLHGPVGLAIGSKTPAEIAISILAEITSDRHYLETSIKNEQIPQISQA